MIFNFKFSEYRTLISKEIFFQVFEKGIRVILGLIIISKLSDYLGPEQYGSLIFIESNYLLFMGLSGFGLSPEIVKLFVQKKKSLDEFIVNGLFLSFILGTAWFLLFNIWNIYFLSFPLKNALFYVSFLLLLNPIFFIEYYYNSQNKLRFNSIIRVSSYLVCFILKIIAIDNHANLEVFVFIICFEIILTCTILFISLKNKRELLSKRWKLNFKIQSVILKNSFFIFLYGLGINLFSRIDILMIQEYLSLKDLGNYTASFKIIAFLYAFPVIMANTFYPKILLIKDQDITLKKMYFISFWSSVFLFISVMFFKEEILNSLFGKQYDSVQQIFNISAITLVVVGISSTYIKVLYKHTLQKQLFYRSLFGIILNVFLNLILIPLYGVFGVSYATIISIFVVEFFYDFFDPKTRKHHIFKLKSILYLKQ